MPRALNYPPLSSFETARGMNFNDFATRERRRGRERRLLRLGDSANAAVISPDMLPRSVSIASGTAGVLPSILSRLLGSARTDGHEYLPAAAVAVAVTVAAVRSVNHFSKESSQSLQRLRACT